VPSRKFDDEIAMLVEECIGNANDSAAAFTRPRGKRAFDVGRVAARCRDNGFPVGSGFVNSLSRPGGNVTGLSLQGPDLAGKRLELCCASLPLVAADWQYWSTLVIQRPEKSWHRFKQRRAR
jgi:hypothetical protein